MTALPGSSGRFLGGRGGSPFQACGVTGVGLGFPPLEQNVHRARRSVFGETIPEGPIWADEMMHVLKRPQLLHMPPDWIKIRFAELEYSRCLTCHIGHCRKYLSPAAKHRYFNPSRHTRIAGRT